MDVGLRERIHALDSTRNRLNPFFSCPALNNMLSCTESFFNVAQFMHQKKIVIVNLAPKGKIDPHIASAIGGLMVNEIIQTARNMPREIVNPTMLVLDEFQNFVGEDLYSAIPETRQLGLQLVLSHQSCSQLIQGEVDMRGIIWQARNRFMFANDADDADLLAHELASLTFNPMELKDQIEVFRQKKVGQRLVRLNNFSATNTSSHADDRNWSEGANSGRSYQRGRPYGETTYSDGTNRGRGGSSKDATSTGTSQGWAETLVDELQDFYEISSRTYFSFEEQMRRWASDVRRLSTGEALGKFKDDNQLYRIDVDQVLNPMFPALAELKEKLLEQNFANRDLFLPRSVVKQRWEEFTAKLGEGLMVPPNEQAVVDAIRIDPPNDPENDAENGSVFR